MAVDLFLGMILGGAVAFVVMLFIIGVIWFVKLLLDKDLKYLIKVINYTGGQPTVEEYKAKKVMNKHMGEVYFIPALKKQKRQYLVYLGSKYEYPTKKGKYVVIFVDRDGDRVPIEFNPTVTEQREMILNYKFLTKEELENLPDKDKEYLSKAKDKNQTFFKVTREIKVDVLRPVPKNIRKFIIDNDRQIAEENPADLTWWDKNKQEVVMLAMIAIIGAVLIFVTIFAYQHADKVLASAQAAPAWAQSFVNASQANVAIPKLG